VQLHIARSSDSDVIQTHARIAVTVAPALKGSDVVDTLTHLPPPLAAITVG
jgi:hypothetical protein